MSPEKLIRVAECEFESNVALTLITTTGTFSDPDDPADALGEIAIKYNLYQGTDPKLVNQFGEVADRYRENEL